MKTKAWTAFIILVAMAMFPGQALAAICFQMTPVSQTTPYIDIVVLEVDGGPAGIYYNLLGEVVNACGDGTSMLLNGAAHLRDDGKAHFGIRVQSVMTIESGSCLPYSIQGTLDPPSFNSGAGFVGNNAGGITAVTFSSVECPAIPQ